MKARRLTVLDVNALGLNAIVGSGIFVFPGTLAALVGPASILIFAAACVLVNEDADANQPSYAARRGAAFWHCPVNMGIWAS